MEYGDNIFSQTVSFLAAVIANDIADHSFCREGTARKTQKVHREDGAIACVKGPIMVTDEVKRIFLLGAKQGAEVTLCNFQNIACNIPMCLLVNFRTGFFVRPFNKAEQITLWLVQKDLQIANSISLLDVLVCDMAFPDELRC
jgi:hypothetical protein